MDNTNTTKREFQCDIIAANDLITEQDARIAELESQLAIKPTASASLSEQSPVAAVATPVTPPPASAAPAKPELTGLARAAQAQRELNKEAK
jgi:hypothetical protein